MMKMLKITAVSLVLATLLSGCNSVPFSDVNVTKQKVAEYNELVDGTLDAYTKAKVNATDQKDSMFNYIIKDQEWLGVSSQTSLNLTPLTPDQLKSFELYGVVYDKFFTSLGVTAIREVLVINGNGYRMYVTILWGEKEVVSVSRVVEAV